MTPEREIGGVLYSCERLSATRAVDLMLRAAEVFDATRPVFGALPATDRGAFVRSFVEFLSGPNVGKSLGLLLELAALPTGPDGRPADLDEIDLPTACALAAFALDASLEGFGPVDGLGSIGARVARELH